MIDAARAQKIASLVAGGEPTAIPTWNAVCDRFRRWRRGLRGAAANSTAQRQPVGSGKWVHAKIGFEKYFLHKIRSGTAEPFYEKLALQMLGIDKLKAVTQDKSPGEGI